MIPVQPVTDQEGTELLLPEHAPSEVDVHWEKCGKIIRRLGGLPLAIDQAAAYIHFRQLPSDRLDEFLRLYEAQRNTIYPFRRKTPPILPRLHRWTTAQLCALQRASAGVLQGGVRMDG